MAPFFQDGTIFQRWRNFFKMAYFFNMAPFFKKQLIGQVKTVLTRVGADTLLKHNKDAFSSVLVDPALAQMFLKPVAKLQNSLKTHFRNHLTEFLKINRQKKKLTGAGYSISSDNKSLKQLTSFYKYSVYE